MVKERETVPCKHCGVPTPMLNTKECDLHWELRWRIELEPELAARMLNDLARKQHEAATVLA